MGWIDLMIVLAACVIFVSQATTFADAMRTGVIRPVPHKPFFRERTPGFFARQAWARVIIALVAAIVAVSVVVVDLAGYG